MKKISDTNAREDNSQWVDIIQNALNQPVELINVRELLNQINNEENEYLSNKTIDSIQQDIYDSLKTLHLSPDVMKSYFCKLGEYRYVDEIYQLHKGKHVRWIRTEPRSGLSAKNEVRRNVALTNGGIVVDIKFLNNGTHVLCKSVNNHFIQYKFDDCYTYQKLTMEEQMILTLKSKYSNT